jgi:hypothetical protein
MFFQGNIPERAIVLLKGQVERKSEQLPSDGSQCVDCVVRLSGTDIPDIIHLTKCAAPKREGSSPCSQELATSPYSEPREFTRTSPANLPMIPCSRLRLGLTNGLFLRAFQHERCTFFSSFPCMPPA